MFDPDTATRSIEDAAGIEAIDVFRKLPREGVKAVIALARVELLASGCRILSQGDDARRAYAVLSGGVRIRQTGSDGAQALMRLIAPGEMFGTVALFTDHRYPADAETAMPSRIATWSEADLLSLMTRYPQISINIIGMIGERLAETQDRIREMATQSAERRIAHVLLRLAERVGTAENGASTIRIPLRRKDVAELAGTTLYTASRTLTRWQREGLLAGRGRILILQDVGALRRHAER